MDKILEFKNGFNNVKSLKEPNTKFINVLDVLSNTNIYNEKIKDSIYITFDDMQKFSIRKNDILFLRSSETREEVGLANVYMDEVESTFGGFVIRGRIIGNYKINSIYLKNYLNTKGRNQIFKKAGGSTRFNIGQDILNEVIVELPRVEIQNRVINFLSSIDILIEKQEEYINQLEKQNNYLIDKIFSNNSSWKHYRLKDITYKMDSGGTPRSTVEKYYNGNIPFLSIADISNEKLFTTAKFISELGLENSSSKIIKKNNIIYTMYATPGIAFLNLIDVAIPQSVIGIELKENYNQYLILKQLNFNRNKILSLAMTGTQANLTGEIVKNLIVKLPPLEEQNRIASLLSSMDKLIELNKKKKEQLNLKVVKNSGIILI